MEDAIRQLDLAQSVQRYQLAVDEAKVRLNLAVCPGAWLMPARMIINTESTVGYNKKLKQAVAGMKLRVNNEVNPETKKAALKLMAGGPSKINPPNSQPSNSVHKAVTASSKQAPSTRQKNRAHDTKNRARCSTTRNKQNRRHRWYGRSRGFAVHGATLTLPFEIFFNNKDNSRQNQKPGVLGKIAYRLPGRFEKEARNRANQPGQQGSDFGAYAFCAYCLKRPSPSTLPVAF